MQYSGLPLGGSSEQSFTYRVWAPVIPHTACGPLLLLGSLLVLGLCYVARPVWVLQLIAEQGLASILLLLLSSLYLTGREPQRLLSRCKRGHNQGQRGSIGCAAQYRCLVHTSSVRTTQDIVQTKQIVICGRVGTRACIRAFKASVPELPG